MDFRLVGFLLAALSALAQAAHAALAKQCLGSSRARPLSPDKRDKPPSEMELFALAAVYATGLLAPLWAAVDLPRAMRPDYSTVGLLLLNGCCNLADKLLSFWLLCLLASPVSAAVVSVVKRVIIVAAAALWSAASAGLAA